MREIPLTRGFVAVVDDIDYDRLSAHKWHASGTRTIYAARVACFPDGPRVAIKMHRDIVGASRGEQVDHRNRNTLDNTRGNLRKCSQTQNQANRGKLSNSKMPHKGISRSARGLPWLALIRASRRTMYLGAFATPEEAARAYDAAARVHFGEFACCNFPSANEAT